MKVIGLGLGINRISGGGAGVPFSPLSLFADGQTGYLRLPGGPAFTAPDGTVQSTAVDDAVGLSLDGSQGAGYSGGVFTGLGSEIADDPGFDNPAAWTTGTGVSVSGGEAIFSSAGSGQNLFADGTGIVSGDFYRVSISVSEYTAGNLEARLGSSGTDVSVGITAIGDYSVIVRADASDTILRFLTLGSPNTYKLSDTSFRQLPGNHATQSNASFKGRIAADGVSINGDGIDDRLPLPFQHGSSGCIAARVYGDTGGRFFFGAQGSSTGRAYLGLDSSGRAAGGVGNDATATIFGGSDLRGSWATLILNWDGSTVTLTVNGTEVYSGAQDGNPAAVDAHFLGLNNNGTAAAFWDGDVKAILMRDEALTADEITKLSNAWSDL